VRQVGDGHALLIIKQEAMAPGTVGGLTGGMAHGGHIHRENYKFTGVGGPAPLFAFSRILDLQFEDLDPSVYNRHTLRTVQVAASQSLPT
jgi:hypothetical protein